MPVVIYSSIHLFTQCTCIQNFLCARHCAAFGCRRGQRPYLQIGEANRQSNNCNSLWYIQSSKNDGGPEKGHPHCLKVSDGEEHGRGRKSLRGGDALTEAKKGERWGREFMAKRQQDQSLRE